MISIIICSRHPELLKLVSQDVEKTIGVPYEIIAIDNSSGNYGICEAYNLGAESSKYDILCFMHEDISFETDKWGETVLNIFSTSSIGALGVAGSTYVSDVPCPWWENGVKNKRVNIYQVSKNGEKSLDYENIRNEKISEVAVLDGVWICTRKNIWEKYKFDATTFNNFHFYDIDYCSDIVKQHKVMVTYEVLINHSSTGSVNEQWVLNALKYYNKRREQLPIGCSNYNKRENENNKMFSYYVFNQIMRKILLDKSLKIKYLFKMFYFNPLSKYNLYYFLNTFVDLGKLISVIKKV